ncbi:MAG TPA: FHA domain-containing protein [Polyangia bacterium]|nr:FHA domain-containing protein [Polyangia bacterium]
MWRIIAFDHDGREIRRLEVERGELTIGRDADRQLVLPSPAVSRKHARLVLDGPQPYILDEGSANGVRINGVRISGPTALVPGAQVEVADFRLDISQPQAAAPSPLPGMAGGAVPGGAALPLASPSGALDPADVVRLLGQGGAFDGRVFDIPAGDVGLGRALENGLVLDDPSLSRRHARLRLIGGGRLEVEDLGSSNGTYVNGRKIGRATVGPGDTLRFGDVAFRLQGEHDEYSATMPGAKLGRRWLLIGGLGTTTLLLVGIVLWIVLRRTTTAPPPNALEQLTQQAVDHMRRGKELLAERKFDAAATEFEQTISLDPANEEAHRLKALADGEPQNERFSKRVQNYGEQGDRMSLERAVRFLEKIPPESAFHDPSAKRLGEQLVLFGQGQCKTRKYLDCAWALCKSFELGRAGGRPDPGAVALLKEAERKLVKDKSWSGCKVKLAN